MSSTQTPSRSPRFFARTRLSHFVAALGSLGLALIVAGTAIFTWTERTRLLRDAASQAESASLFLADHAARLFEVADVAILTTTAGLGTSDWDTIAKSNALYGSMKAVTDALPYISDIWLNDAEGRLRLTSLAFPSPESSATDRLAFKLIQHPGSGLVVGDLITAKLTGKKTFLVARRLEWPDGGFRGMVSATADLAYFMDYWSRLSLPYGSHVALRSASLSETFVEFPPQSLALTDPLVAPPAIVATSVVANVPLLVRVTIARGAVLGAWHRWLGTYLPLALGAALSLLALTGFAIRQGRREAASLQTLGDTRMALAQANAGLEATIAIRTAELRETTEEVRQFAYLVSHDLRGPLLNVTGFAGELASLRPQLFAPQPLPEPERADLARDFDEMIGFIRAGTASMDNLLRHILALSREGRRTSRPEPLDMTALIQNLANGQRFQCEQAGATIAVHPLPALVADRLAVEQMFGNLIDNAVKYRDPSRPCSIEVSGRPEGGRLMFEVADNGRGIAPPDQARVFELFRRAGPQTIAGEGIGLAFVRTLARLLGGHVDLRSEPGIGSTFRVTLPSGPPRQ